jgi:hypothetical protein
MPTPTYEHIVSTTLSANTSTVDFTSIPSTYTDLVLTYHAKSVNNSTAGNGLRLNNDSTSGNYYAVNYSQYGNTSTSTIAQSNLGGSRTEAYGSWNAASNTDGMNMMAIVHLNNYSDTTKRKTVLSRAGSNAGGGGFNATEITVTSWNSNAAINRITLTNGDVWASGSVFTLHGIKAG